MIASKSNKKEILIYLISKGAIIDKANILRLNVLDYSIIYGNYDIAYHLKNNNYNLHLKDLNEYIRLNNHLKEKFFNLPLLYKSLSDNVEPCNLSKDYFKLNKNQIYNLTRIIPYSNEEWTSFFERGIKVEGLDKENKNKSEDDDKKINNYLILTQPRLGLDVIKIEDYNDDVNKTG